MILTDSEIREIEGINELYCEGYYKILEAQDRKSCKEFAEEIIETIPLVRIPVKLDTDYPITETAMFTQALNEAFATEYNEVIAHIRAMAEGGQ